MQQAANIGAVITNALSSVGAIAAGNISGAIGFIDRALGGTIPVALAWLSKVVGLGNFGGKVKIIINRVKGKLDSVVDKIVAKVKGIIEKMMGKGKPGEKKPGETQANIAKRNKELSEKEKQEKLNKAIKAISPRAQQVLRKGVPKNKFEALLQQWRSQYDLTSLTRTSSGKVTAKINPIGDLEGVDADPISIGKFILPIFAEAEQKVKAWMMENPELKALISKRQQAFNDKKANALSGLPSLAQQHIIRNAKTTKGYYKNALPGVNISYRHDGGIGKVENLGRYEPYVAKSGRDIKDILGGLKAGFARIGLDEKSISIIFSSTSEGQLQAALDFLLRIHSVDKIGKTKYKALLTTVAQTKRAFTLHKIFEPARMPGVHTTTVLGDGLVANNKANPEQVMTGNGDMAVMTPRGAAKESSSQMTPQQISAEIARYQRTGQTLLHLIANSKQHANSSAEREQLLINSEGGRVDLSSVAEQGHTLLKAKFPNSSSFTISQIENAVKSFSTEVVKVIKIIGGS